MKPPEKKKVESDDTIVKVYGPYDSHGKRSVMIKKSPTIRAFINADNCCIKDLMSYRVKEIKGDSETLSSVVKDISNIRWIYENPEEKPKEEEEEKKEDVKAEPEFDLSFELTSSLTDLLQIAVSIDEKMGNLLEVFKNAPGGK